jgi:hypothetical protein
MKRQGYAGFAECGDCGSPVVRYSDAGLVYDLAVKTVPRQDATVLHRYGHHVAILVPMPPQLGRGGWIVGTYTVNAKPISGTLHAEHRCSARYETVRR